MHPAKRSKLASGAPHTTATASATATANATATPLVASAAIASPTHKYLSHLLLLSTAQLATHAGFTTCRRSVLTSLAEIASRYIESIGVASSSAAATAGRSEVSLHDILYGLNEMGVEFSEMRQWKEMTQHEEIPFAHTIPIIPRTQEVIIVEPIPATQPSNTTAAARPPHIPPSLPTFPPRRTYAYTPEMKSVETDGVVSRKRKVDENRKLESALVTLHQAAAKAALEMALEAEKELRVPLPPERERTVGATPPLHHPLSHMSSVHPASSHTTTQPPPPAPKFSSAASTVVRHNNQPSAPSPTNVVSSSTSPTVALQTTAPASAVAATPSGISAAPSPPTSTSPAALPPPTLNLSPPPPTDSATTLPTSIPSTLPDSTPMEIEPPANLNPPQ